MTPMTLPPMQRAFRPLLLAARAAPFLLAACGRQQGQSAATTSVSATPAGKDIHVDGHGVSLVNGNLQLHAEGQPPAAITPDGQLRIGARAVALTPAQRQLVLDYRQHVLGIADQGIEVGKQGAALGASAAGEAVKAVLAGDTDQLEQRIKAQTGQVRQAALKICDAIEGLRTAQDALAAQVPAFRPYADVQAGDADDCRRDAQED